MIQYQDKKDRDSVLYLTRGVALFDGFTSEPEKSLGISASLTRTPNDMGTCRATAMPAQGSLDSYSTYFCVLYIDVRSALRRLMAR